MKYLMAVIQRLILSAASLNCKISFSIGAAMSDKNPIKPKLLIENTIRTPFKASSTENFF